MLVTMKVMISTCLEVLQGEHVIVEMLVWWTQLGKVKAIHIQIINKIPKGKTLIAQLGLAEQFGLEFFWR